MINIQVWGAGLVERTLRDIAPREALTLTRATVGAVASEIMKDARKEMPKQTGALRRAVKKRRRQVRRGIVREDIVVAPGAFYWRFHEYGNGRVRERAMFGKAVHKMRGRIGPRFEELFLKKLTARLARARSKRANR